MVPLFLLIRRVVHFIRIRIECALFSPVFVLARGLRNHAKAWACEPKCTRRADTFFVSPDLVPDSREEVLCFFRAVMRTPHRGRSLGAQPPKGDSSMKILRLAAALLLASPAAVAAQPVMPAPVPA